MSSYSPLLLFGGALLMMAIGGVLVTPRRLNGVTEVRFGLDDRVRRDSTQPSIQGGDATAAGLATSQGAAGPLSDVHGVDPAESAEGRGPSTSVDPLIIQPAQRECKRVLNGTEHVGIVRYCECYAREGELDPEFREVAARVGPVDFSMHVYRRADFVSNEITSRKAWELPTSTMFLDAMRREFDQLVATNASAQKSDIAFLDIGANIGWYSILMAAHGYRVIAIEPMTKNIQALRASVCVNNLQHLMEVHHTALAEEKQECGIVSHGINTGDGIVVCDDSWKKEGYTIREVVHINRLDNIIPEATPIKLAKIDVEGYEDHVLGGGLQTLLGSGISKIMSEFAPEMMSIAQSDPLHYLNMWGDGGYVIRKAGFGMGEILQPSEFGEAINLWKNSIVNIFIEKKQEDQSS